MAGDGLVAVPADVVARRTRVEHGVEHQLHGAGAGADHQVDTGYGLRKALPRVDADSLH
jgi:hypothetical protein